jgi:hypothetical protein
MASPGQITVGVELQNVRETHAKVERRLQELQEQIQKIENALPPADEYEAHPGVCKLGELRIWCIEYVKARPPKPSAELTREVEKLQSEIGRLRLRERKLVHQVQMRQRADSASREFGQRLRDRLREAERTGELPEDELAELLEQSEAVLGNYTDILRQSPSPENIRLVLKHMDVPLTLGGSALTGKSGEGWEAVGGAAERLLQGAQQDFDRVPSVGNFDRLLSRMQMAQAFGKGADTFTRPPDFKPVGTMHPVAPGESLSGIAKHYYGKANYWPYIYFENFRNLDPDRLTAGAMIWIP